MTEGVRVTEGVRRVVKSLRLEHPDRVRHGDTGVLRAGHGADAPELGGSVLHALERRFQEALRLEERGATDPAGVHDRRVALRRLRAALALAGLRGHARRARALQGALGRLRELQLHHPARGGARAEAERRRALAARAAEWLADGAPRLARRLRQLVARGIAPGAVRSRLEHDVTRLAAALQALDPALAPGQVHPARLAARRLRDDLEAVGPDRLAAAGGLLPRLVELHEALGALRAHDRRVAPGRAPSAERRLLEEPVRRTLRGLSASVHALHAELGPHPHLQRADL